jgi:hypothetical protein
MFFLSSKKEMVAILHWIGAATSFYFKRMIFFPGAGPATTILIAGVSGREGWLSTRLISRDSVLEPDLIAELDLDAARAFIGTPRWRNFFISPFAARRTPQPSFIQKG